MLASDTFVYNCPKCNKEIQPHIQWPRLKYWCDDCELLWYGAHIADWIEVNKESNED